jgi:CRISPR/Cas system-associated exonuclease Cas4 (RecB family)
MILPGDFQFSQGSLQDYVDCPRRFQLRYLLRLAWPALEAEPALESERRLQQGAAFHRLVHQHVLGLPAERLSSAATGADLRRWWRNYLAQPPADLPLARYPEIILSAPVSGHRLIAKYDLVAADPGRRANFDESLGLSPGRRPGRAVVVDWKTSRRRPRRRWLAGRLQTRVYPYLLVRAGAHLNDGQPLQPEQVEMVYWFADFPADPERFAYDAAQYEADGVYLATLIEEIERLGGEGFPLTARKRRCRYCIYRSLCRRGVAAGVFEEAEAEAEPEDEFDISLDFEQIAEVEY